MTEQLLLGALAGAVGGIGMKAVIRFVDPDSFGLSAHTDAQTAHEIWRLLKWEPVSDRSAAQIGAAMHYGFALAAGAAYAASAARFPIIRTGRGAAFGAALFLIDDELSVSSLRLEDPRRTPVFSHLSALGAHLLYGIIVDAVQLSVLKLQAANTRSLQ